MRILTVKREKSLLDKDIKLSVYIEDGEGEAEILGAKYRLLCQLENGEEKSLSIDCEQRDLLVIKDISTAEACKECYTLPSGEESISLVGRMTLNLTTGNVFRFNTEAEAARKRRNILKGFLAFIGALIIGFSLGYLIVTVIFSGMGGKDKQFSAEDMTITLTEAFSTESSLKYDAIFHSGKVDVTASKSEYKDSILSLLTPADYARYIIQQNGIKDSEPKTDEGLCYFVYNTGSDGEYRCYAFTYKTDDAHWLIQFVTKESQAKKYEADIMKWAASVEFK